ncbi:unnamed protein product [Moneuplotes crassus]|uniref:Uncharacterized protein n=1 Tax=Euplotes crassus TaxID=5936 RepID=A0AAD1X9T6_EUPCR|nr:unnamed protein product [Moneuplotes crassus]
MKTQKSYKRQHKNITEQKEEDSSRLMELLDDAGIYRGEETSEMFRRAGITYLSLLQAIQLQDHMYLGSLQAMCHLSNEEMSILSFNLLRRLKDPQHNEEMLEEYGPQFYSAMRPPMTSMPGPSGFPMHQFYRDQNINQGMNPMIYDHLTRDQQYSGQLMGMAYQNIPYYVEQLNHNTTVYNDFRNEQMNLGKTCAESIMAGKKSVATDRSLKGIDDSTIAGTKDKDSHSKQSLTKCDTLDVTNFSDQMKGMIEFSPYFYSNITQSSYMPQNSLSDCKLSNKRSKKEMMRETFGMLPAKNPRVLHPARTLSKKRRIKYGNYSEIQLISYDDLLDPPKSGEDIFYQGRGFRSVHDLNESIERFKQFGFCFIKKKSEVKRGRYELRCKFNSEQKKKAIFPEECYVTQECVVYVYIDRLKVKSTYLKHNHKPKLFIPTEGLERSILYRKNKDDDPDDSIKEEYKLDLDTT